MKKTKEQNSTHPTFEHELYSSLKHSGFLIPTTDQEVKKFEEIYGTTDFALPEDLTFPDFIHIKRLKKKPVSKSNHTVVKASNKNDYFKKIILAAEIANELHSEPTFGHIKFVKVYCLCNEIGKMQLSTKYGKYAAGPLDPKLLYTIDAEFKKRQWFKVVKSTAGFKYYPGEKLDEYKQYYSNYFKYDLAVIQRIIDLFRNENSSFCEKVATLYFVWKEALNEPVIISEKLLFTRFYEWDEKKKRYTEDELNLALNWMNENEVVPVK
jgi:hypothetical protein